MTMSNAIHVLCSAHHDAPTVERRGDWTSLEFVEGNTTVTLSIHDRVLDSFLQAITAAPGGQL